MKKESKRHKERELALWGIFQEDFNLDGKNEKIDCFIEDYPEEEMNSEIAEEAGGYASQVIETFKENRTEIDKMISKYLKKIFLKMIPNLLLRTIISDCYIKTSANIRKQLNILKNLTEY